MKQKLWIVFIVAGLVLFSSSQVQSADIGVKLGKSWVNINRSQDIPGVEFSYRSEIIIGGFLSANLLKTLAVQPEVYYIKKGVDFAEEVEDEFTTEKYSYIEIPVLLKFEIPTKGKIKPGLFAGPYLAFKTKAKEFKEELGITTEIDMNNFVKSTDYGLVFGGCLEYKLGFGKLVFDARLNVGLVNVVKNLSILTNGILDDNDYIKNKSFTIMIGFGF